MWILFIILSTEIVKDRKISRYFQMTLKMPQKFALDTKNAI